MEIITSSYIENNNKININEEELNKIKTIAEYLFMDQYQDMCSYPRFEECFGAFCLDKSIDLTQVFKIICGRKRKYITFRRLVFSYYKWKNSSNFENNDYQKFMQLLFEELLKNPNDGIGNKLEKNVYYSTINSQNRKAISKFSVITEENKEKIKGFRIYYDDFFKNDLFYNNEKDSYFVSLELNLIAERPFNSESTELFPSINDRDGITHIGGTYNDEGINFLVFKCRSGKTSFIGKPNGTPFLFGEYKKELKTIRIGINEGILFYFEPHFENVERFNPHLDKEINEVSDKYLNQDKPIFEEKILVNYREDEVDKNILHPLVSDDRFYNAKKYQDKISGLKFSDICPIVNRIFIKDKNTNKIKINLDPKNLIEEASNFVSQHKGLLINKISQYDKGGIVKQLSGIVNNPNNKLPSVGDIIKDPKNFDSLLGNVSSIIVNDIKNKTKNELVGNIVEGAVSGLGNLLLKDKKGKLKSLPPNHPILQKAKSQDDSIKLRYRPQQKDRLKGISFGGIGNLFNQFNNVAQNFFEFNSSFEDDDDNMISNKDMFDPFGFSSGFFGSNYFFDNSYKKEMEQKRRQQEEIIKRHEEERRKRISEEEKRKKLAHAQSLWKNFSERYSKEEGIFILQTIGAVIKALHLIKDEYSGYSSDLSIEEKLSLLEILKSNRNIILMLNKAKLEALRRKEEEKNIMINNRELERMREEEEKRKEEEKKRLEEEKERRNEEKKIEKEKKRIEEEKRKREEEMQKIMDKIREEEDIRKRYELQREEEMKRIENERKRYEEERKKRELEENERRINEEKRRIEMENRRKEEEKRKKEEEEKRKIEEEAKKKEEEERKILEEFQEKKTRKIK